MKRYRLKVILLHMIAFLAGYTSIFACYPFSVAYFAAAYISDRMRYTLFPMILLGMTLSASLGQVIRYAIAMLFVLLVAGIFEAGKRRISRFVMAGLAGSSVLVASWMLEDELLMAFGEAILVMSLTILFSLLLESFLITNAADYETEILHGPGKQKMEESAEVFRKLAGCFSQMPSRQEGFAAEDRDRMSRQMEEGFCTQCSKCLECWEKNYYDTLTTTSDLFAVMEKQGEVGPEQVKGRMRTQCIRLHAYIGAMRQVFDRARNNLFWYNRLIENREAVAGQLTEMADIMTVVAGDIYDIGDEKDLSVRDRVDRELARQHIKVLKTSVTKKKNGRYEVYVTMHTKGGRCIAAREAARYLSAVLEVPMVPHKDSRHVINGETVTIAFVEDTAFRVLHGAAKAVKPGQQVSGDNYTFCRTDSGQAVACLSDGMGSGIRACRESEAVVELLERFLDAGFCKETALKMINSTMLLTDGEPSCSTIDVCAVDLYDGVCEFVKLGAAATYIRRDHWVEFVQSTSLPVGVDHKMAGETSKTKLFDGDFVVMVSDGIIDAIAEKKPEDYMEDLILKQKTSNPKEMANAILSDVLSQCAYSPEDDMTVLVLGVWKK